MIPTLGYSGPLEHLISYQHMSPTDLLWGLIFYQTILQGYNATLVKDKKQEFIPYGFHIGFYLVKDTAQDKQEGLSQLDF